MHILDKIVAHKQAEIAQNKRLIPISALKDKIVATESDRSLKTRLKDNRDVGIIAEFKRKSPSKPSINLTARPEEIVAKYQKAGVAGISVLTDAHFFGGSYEDILQARSVTDVPILRKDFILDEYQIFEAKAMGADVILLIASILDKKEILDLSQCAKELGLEILFEVHSPFEIEKFNDDIDIIGVNNRNLDTFEVDFNNSIALYSELPPDCAKISESGIHNIETLRLLRSHGYDGFLIGQRFMETKDPGKACHDFIADFKKAL